jgi:ribose transport system ATP-binding protein
LNGRQATLSSPSEAMRAGIAYVPEDRAGAAAFLDTSIAENLSIARIGAYRSGPRMDKRRERADAAAAIERYSVKAPSGRALLGTLSGGNQQKVIVARWLARDPSVLLLDEPTQGVDIGARSDIYQLIELAIERGCAVVLVSSDFEELVHVSDRVVVLVNGRITASLPTDGLDSRKLTELVYTDLEVTS